MTTSEQIDQIAAAGAKAQKELKPALKDAENPHYKSRYANEAAVRDAARVFADNGIAVWQGPVTTADGVEVTTLLTHSSGQWIKFDPYLVPLQKRDAHGVGSATTYAKRYALSAALGIAADDDDDGNDAVGKKGKTNEFPRAVAQPLPETPRKSLPTDTHRVLSCEASGDKPWRATLVDAAGEQIDVTIWSEPIRNLAVECSQDGPPVVATINKQQQLTKLKRHEQPKLLPDNVALDAEIAKQDAVL